MRTIFQQLLFVSLLSALVACLQPEDKPPVVDPPIDETPIKSAFGTPVGNAVTQSFDATGGSFTEPSAGVTVKAFVGGFDSSTQVSVQPITNTLPDGIGMGVAISSSQPPKKPLIVRFAYGANEPDPNSLRLAMQADDGSWFSLAPVKIDTVNKTVSAALPETLPTIAGASSRVKPMAGLDLTRVVEYRAFYMKPKSATVKVGKSVDFVPWARVLEKEPCQSETAAGSDDELVNLCKPKKVVKEYPFTNDKSGFVRTWFVNGIDGGDSTIGTVKPKPTAGATYTAPAKVPSPNTVDVRFLSAKTGQNQNAPASAKVTIISEYNVVGDFTATGHLACTGYGAVADLTDHVEFKLANNGSTIGSPYLIESIQNQPTVNKNFRSPAVLPGITVTQDSTTEAFDATTGSAVGAADSLEVLIEGQRQMGGCTITYPPNIGIPPLVHPAGNPVPTYVLFQFNLNAFTNDTQKVTVSDPNPFNGTWEFTITRQ
jgi:hypothetical protein